MAITQLPVRTQRIQDFITSGTFTVPSGVFSAEFLVVGAGGGGGGCDNSVITNSSVGGGGGGGAVKYVTLPTTPGASYTITVGAKGIGGIQTAGGNGGFSEVVLSAVTLIRSYGGGGGSGVTAADVVTDSPVSKTMAGNGGSAHTSTGNNTGSGGGGALLANYQTGSNGNNVAIEGQNSFVGNAGSFVGNHITIGGLGINGLGAGGGGGAVRSGSPITAITSTAPFGAGDGVYRRAAGAANALAATIAGCGGGGGASMTTLTQSDGGAGFDGLVRISYVG